MAPSSCPKEQTMENLVIVEEGNLEQVFGILRDLGYEEFRVTRYATYAWTLHLDSQKTNLARLRSRLDNENLATVLAR